MKTNTTREDSLKELLDTSTPTQIIKINKLLSENTHKIKIKINNNKNKINLLKSMTKIH